MCKGSRERQKARERNRETNNAHTAISSSPSFFNPIQPSLYSLCCLCGASILPNPSNMCVTCIRSQVDITEGLSKSVSGRVFAFF
jgi:hypothetical protein